MTEKIIKSKEEERHESLMMSKNKKNHWDDSPRHIRYVIEQAQKAKTKKTRPKIDVQQAVKQKRLIR